MSPTNIPLELNGASLSTSERRAYEHYLNILGLSGGSAGSTITLVALRTFACRRLGAPPPVVDEVLDKLPQSADQGLSERQVYAVLRLLAHTVHSSRSGLPHRVDAQLIYVPIDPLPLLPPPAPSRKPSTTRKPSDPFAGAEEGSLDLPVKSAPATMSNNPFRQRLASHPATMPSSQRAPPPPLPPRRTSVSGDKPSLPPRKPSMKLGKIAGSSSSSELSIAHPQPTRMVKPSLLMLHSLQAADEAHGRIPGQEGREVDGEGSSTSSMASSSKPAAVRRKSMPVRGGKDPRAVVSEALQRAEEDAMPEGPPRRTRPRKSSFQSAAKPWIEKDPAAKLWSCVDVVNGETPKRPYAMIVLNQPITRKDIFLRAWNACELRLCADGGSNRLYDLFNADQRALYLPNIIKGDLDSIRSDVHSYYAKQGVSIKHDGDEYATDLMKCIEEVEAAEKSLGERYSIVLLGGLSGRVDQTVHTMSLLQKMRKTRPETYVLSGESLAWTLDEGSHIVDIDHTTMGQTCGLLPVGVDEAYVSTSGLKWDLDWVTSLSTTVSTSNHLLPEEPVVYIKTTRPILWCIEIKPSLPSIPRPSGSRTVSSGHHRSVSLPKRVDTRTATQDFSTSLNALAHGVGRLAKDASRGVGQLAADIKERRDDPVRRGEERGLMRDRREDSGGSDREDERREGWQQLA